MEYAVISGPKGYAFSIQKFDAWDQAVTELQHQYEQIEEWLIGEEDEEQYQLSPEPPIMVNGIMEAFTVRHNGTVSEYKAVKL